MFYELKCLLERRDKIRYCVLRVYLAYDVSKEWPNMADKLDKPPDAVEPVNSTENQIQSSTNVQQTCNCTKISVMLLIHEMKQKFATIPDQIVSQYVMDNCHNRSALVDFLEREAEKYPGSVQAYPQALRVNKRSLTPRRSAPPVPNNNNNIVKADSQKIQNSTTTKCEGTESDCKISDSISVKDDTNKEKLPERPSTLNIANVPNVGLSSIRKPCRVPPPPPNAPTPLEAINSNCQQTATSTPDSNESLNVSLNVMVSPVSGRPPPARPPRHTTAISVHPESPLLHDPLQSPRSYTSVNFTLRQPGDKTQSPIEITAGPSLTYSSRSYDARAGFQSHLAITVGGNGGSISASRIRSRNCYNSISEGTDNSGALTSTQNGILLPNVIASTSTSVVQPMDDGEKAELVHRQMICKERLFAELKNEKNHLRVMLHEISVLQSPLPPGTCTSLLDEIQHLRNACNQMAQEVDESYPSTDQTNNTFYDNIYTGQRLSVQQNRSPRTQRRQPPPYVLRCLSGRGSNSVQSSNIHRQLDDTDNDNVNQENDQPWTCKMCTFQNHPLLNKCEQCEMPLLSTSGTVQANTQQQYLTPSLQHIPYQQSIVAVPNPMQYNSSIGFNDLPPRLTQQH